MAFCTCMAYGSQKAVLETVKGTLTLSHSHPFSAMYYCILVEIEHYSITVQSNE